MIQHNKYDGYYQDDNITAPFDGFKCFRFLFLRFQYDYYNQYDNLNRIKKIMNHNKSTSICSISPLSRARQFSSAL